MSESIELESTTCFSLLQVQCIFLQYVTRMDDMYVILISYFQLYIYARMLFDKIKKRACLSSLLPIRIRNGGKLGAA